ncbi:hypothetical protein ACQP3D_30455, partial [Escherichia coli]
KTIYFLSGQVNEFCDINMSIWPVSILRNKTGTAEMVQWLRVFAALAKDLDLVPRIHMAAHNCLEL